MEYKQLEGSKMASLPIFKHFSEGEVKLNPQEWRKGEKWIFALLALGALVAGGYLLWVYVLPIIGLILQMIIAGGTALLLIVARKGIHRFFKNIARGIHKTAINHDPFAELEDQEKQMVKSEGEFNKSRGQIKRLKEDMRLESAKQEDLAKRLQGSIVGLHKEISTMDAELKQIETQLGKDSDEYVELKNAKTLKLADAQQADYLYTQAKDFVEKYGVRANIMGKLDQKLSTVSTHIKIKIKDFQTTVLMLRRDADFAANAKRATDAAKSAMMFDTSWELDYALEVVKSTIASDLAITQSNIMDINNLTANFQINDEAMFDQLEVITNRIKSGDEKIPEAKKFNNLEYRPTAGEKAKSGGLDIF